MLKPAIAYKDELNKLFAEHIYDDDMFWYCGTPAVYVPNIEVKDNNYQWAIIDGIRVIGYIAYTIEVDIDCVCNFGLYSFDKGNIVLGKDVDYLIKKLVKQHHRIEWRMVSGNPVEHSYDYAIRKFDGKKIVLRDTAKDANGKYHDSIIYEIINNE